MRLPRVAFVVASALSVLGALWLAGPAVAEPYAESFSAPPEGWQRYGDVGVQRVAEGDETVLRLYTSTGGRLSRRLSDRPWGTSFDIELAPGTKAVLRLGDTRHYLRLRRPGTGSLVHARLGDGPQRPLEPKRGWPGRRWRVEAAGGRSDLRISVGGHRFEPLSPSPGRELSLGLTHGRLRVDNLLASNLDSKLDLLLHRLSQLQQRIPAGSWVHGAETSDRLHLDELPWVRGFFPGALWLARDATGSNDMFARFALRRTIANTGIESTYDGHDLGFMYELSSLAALRRLCLGDPRCGRLRQSALAAADRLMELAASNRGGETIPMWLTRPSRSEADVIIDSLMNLPLLHWASGATGDPGYRDTAARHAHRVKELLVRRNGSTFQSIHLDRRTGRVLFRHTHQGASKSSTWARGQAWAVYGFAVNAEALDDPVLLRTAERVAAYIERELPASGVPRYDYSETSNERLDTSAGVISAAGLFRLAAVCERRPGACERRERWRALGDRMLRASLGHVRARPPLGYLARQCCGSWQRQAELIYGLYYALEAGALRRR